MLLLDWSGFNDGTECIELLFEVCFNCEVMSNLLLSAPDLPNPDDN